MSHIPPHSDQDLFQDFQPMTMESWKQKILKDLKGKPYETLQWKLETGQQIEPFYTRHDLEGLQNMNTFPGEYPFIRGSIFHREQADWQIVQQIPLDHSAEATQVIKEALLADVGAFDIMARQAPIDPESLMSIWEEVDIHKQAIHIGRNSDPLAIIEHIAERIEEKGQRREWLTGTLLNDPLALAAQKEKLPTEIDWEYIKEVIFAGEKHPYFKALGLDLSYVYERGGNVVQELAYAIASLVAYADHLVTEESGLNVTQVLANVAYRFNIGGSFLLEVAKLRAFRWLYAKVVAAYGIDQAEYQSPFVIAQTGIRNKSTYEEHTNILRQTSEVISAIFGGANAVVTSPFDALSNDGNPFSHRMARNIQHILKQEAYLNKVVDPAGGSYYLETLTHQLAKEAWSHFQEIEKMGGFMVAIQENKISSAIEENAKQQLEALYQQKKVLIGVNRYINPQELKRSVSISEDHRLASELEGMRAKNDQLLSEKGNRLKVLLWKVGVENILTQQMESSKQLWLSVGFEVEVWECANEEIPESDVKDQLSRLLPELIVLHTTEEWADVYGSRWGKIIRDHSDAIALSKMNNGSLAYMEVKEREELNDHVNDGSILSTVWEKLYNNN